MPSAHARDRGPFDTAVVNGTPRWLSTYAKRWRTWPELRNELDDLVQDTLACALARGVDPLDSLADGRPGKRAAQYLKSILRNRAVDAIRKARGCSVCIDCGDARMTRGVGRCRPCSSREIRQRPRRPPRPPPEHRCTQGCGTRVARPRKRCRSCSQKDRWQSFRSAPQRDLIGRRVGRLVVLAPAPSRTLPGGGRASFYEVRCDCGTQKQVRRTVLARGKVSSCGCARGGWRPGPRRRRSDAGVPRGRRTPVPVCIYGCGARVCQAGRGCRRCAQCERRQRESTQHEAM